MRWIVKVLMVVVGLAAGSSLVGALGATASCRYCVQVRQYCSFVKSDDQFTAGAKDACQSLPDTALLTVHGFPENQEDWPQCGAGEENMLHASILDDDDASGCAWCNGPNSTCHDKLDEGACHQSCGSEEEFVVLASQLDSLVARGNLVALATFLAATPHADLLERERQVVLRSQCDPTKVRHAIALDSETTRLLRARLQRVAGAGYVPIRHIAWLL